MPDTDQISAEAPQTEAPTTDDPAGAAAQPAHDAWRAQAFDIVCQEDADVGVAVFDREARLLQRNARWGTLFANASSLADLFKNEAERVAAPIKRCLETGVAFENDVALADARGETRTLRLRFRPLAGGETIAVLARDTTASDDETMDTSPPEGRLRHVLDALSTMMFLLDSDGVLVEANAAALMVANLQPTDVIGRKLADTYWWSWDEEARERLRQAIGAARDGALQRYREKLRVGADRLIAIMLQISALRDPAGRVTQLAASAIDVSELVEMQERQALLAAELTHRVKNILAIVQALVSRAARRAPSKEALAASLEGRIRAMAAAITQLSRSQWTGYDLDGVIAEQLEVHGGDRIFLDGPRVRLSPKAAMAFALIAYELGSNAAKHGALRTSEGRVTIGWRIEGPALDFTWRESGGPPPEALNETGFGSTLVRNLAEGDLGAETQMDFAADGVAVRLRAPLERLRQPADAETGLRENPERPLAGRRILIVEESPIIALDLASLLETAGAAVVGPFVALADAAAAIERERVDIALLNTEMGGVSASPLARRAEARGAALLFAVAGEDAAAARRDFPRARVLAKPYSETEMLQALAATAWDRE